jgi:type 2 lantibiotic biosynthesis protein LanM
VTAPSVEDARNFDASLGCLFASALDGLAAQLAEVPGLPAAERDLLVDVTRESLLSVLHGRLARLLLLELNAARVRGELAGDTSEARWAAFIARSSTPAFWQSLAPEYPDLLSRVARLVGLRCDNTHRFAVRFAADREALSVLVDGAPLGALRAVSFGAGDTHRGGQTVALLQCDGGRVVYKPRSMAIDHALATFVDELFPGEDAPERIRVPQVLQRDGYGWSAFVAHAYAQTPASLRAFYRGIGHWLAVIRLLNGSDLHAENLIAHRGCPVIIDCETLFTPRLKAIATGLGQAADRALELSQGTVLSCGLLPTRGVGLGFRGVDNSGLGGLPGQQPKVRALDIVGAGSDAARIGTTEVEQTPAQNLPSENPALAEHWPEVIAGFDELTARLHALDAQGALAPRLDRFKSCEIRVVLRATEVYAEIGRMLWHPVSLHEPEVARARAHELFKRQAARRRIAPSDDDVIAGEVEDLREGDIPFFSTLAGHGVLDGPRGTHWMRAFDLVDMSLAQWRSADLPLERRIIRAALVSAYVSDGWRPPEDRRNPSTLRLDDLDGRRRHQAAAIMRELVDSAVRGDDGTVTWIAPMLGPQGWTVQPLEQDLYNGASGIAVLVAAYGREVRAGRADAVEGVDELLPRLVATLALAEEQRATQRRELKRPRPTPPGGYVGLGSQIWSWLQLREWGVEPGMAIEQACAIATYLPDAIASDTSRDLLFGSPGAIVPLLRLAQATGQRRYLEQAIEVGDHVCGQAVVSDGRAHWIHHDSPNGLGGYVHGATGVGWALERLARASGQARFAEMADAARRFEDALWDEQHRNWRDQRLIDGLACAAAWCHGAVGIGLARADLDPALAEPAARRDVQRAAAAAWNEGTGWNHSLCHGDLGVAELMAAAIDAGVAPEGWTRERLLAHVLGSLEEFGAQSGVTRDTFAPGLLPGLGGVAYQLLRLHPACDLPSVLTLTDGVGRPA